MDYGFFFTEKSRKRNVLTSRYEPIQPLLLLEFGALIKAEGFFDIGANIGFYALVGTLVRTVKSVYAFEASKDTFDELKANVELNALDDVVKVENKAVSSEDGTVEFQIESALSGINSVVETSFHRKELFKNTVSVECVALDSYSDQTGQALMLKVDVEGHEAHVIRGAENLLKNNKCVIQIEVYSDEDHEVASLLRTLGYARIFSAKNDHYYSNAPIFNNPQEIVGCTERVAARMIDLHMGSWPPVRQVDALKLTGKQSNGQIVASCEIDEGFLSGELEYAFYVYCNKQKIDTVWYSPSAKLKYTLAPEYKGQNISVTAFVREKNNPEKKMLKSVALGKWA